MTTLVNLQNKILDAEQLRRKLALWRFKQQKIVFTNGCFDLINKGHLHCLSSIADLGQRFIIGLNSDSSVRALKGETRPIQAEETRASILAAFSFVDAVVLFNEATPFNLIQTICPNVLAKGGDYKISEIVGADIVQKNGGEVVLIPYLEGYSTTGILKEG